MLHNTTTTFIWNPVREQTKNKLKINIQGMREELVFGASV